MTVYVDPMADAVPDRLAVARDLAGLTERQAARLTGLSVAEVHAVEAGDRALTPAELATVAEVYDVRPEWLCGHSTANPEAEDALRDLPESDRATLMIVLDSMRRRV